MNFNFNFDSLLFVHNLLCTQTRAQNDSINQLFDIIFVKQIGFISLCVDEQAITIFGRITIAA